MNSPLVDLSDLPTRSCCANKQTEHFLIELNFELRSPIIAHSESVFWMTSTRRWSIALFAFHFFFCVYLLLTLFSNVTLVERPKRVLQSTRMLCDNAWRSPKCRLKSTFIISPLMIDIIALADGKKLTVVFLLVFIYRRSVISEIFTTKTWNVKKKRTHSVTQYEPA